MEKQYNWEELFTIAGFLPEICGPSTYSFQHEPDRYIEHLHRLLKACGYVYSENASVIEMVSPAPSLEEWSKLLETLFTGGTEGTLPEWTDLGDIEVPMLAAFRQMNRLGLHTTQSCAGHSDKRRSGVPYLGFETQSDAQAALKLVTGLGYKARLARYHSLRIKTDHSGLFELGLKLSQVRDIRPYLQQSPAEREALLEELLLIPGESGNEGEVQAYLLKILSDMMDKVEQDETGNILGDRNLGSGPTVLLSAHMDTKKAFAPASNLCKDGQRWERSAGILGADDRAGIAAILNILKIISTYDFKGKIKIVFTVEEEIGQQGAEQIDPNFFRGVDYAISLDRKGSGDIVIMSDEYDYHGEYLGSVFEQASQDLWGNEHIYQKVNGGKSDLRVWSAAGVQSVNLSIGYYNEHHDGEYLNIEEWHRVHDLVLHGMELLTKMDA